MNPRKNRSSFGERPPVTLEPATGAEFQGVGEDDLANLLEGFSGYF